MKTTLMNPVKGFTLIALGLAIAAMGIYVADADDAPGAAVIGIMLMVVGVVLGVRVARNQLSTQAARLALAAGIIAAAFAAFLSYTVAVTALNFPQEQVPSVVGSAPAPEYAAAVDRARELVRNAVQEQHLPGVSVAVAAGLRSEALAKEGGTVVWAEGFGWRDVVTRTPVTPDTRFNIGTAAPAVIPSVTPLGLTNTGTDSATVWSPEHVGEPEEDFPPFRLLRHVLWQPLGLMREEYPLPGDRATFYVPRSDGDPRRGRRLMYMRDLACCADGMAFYSTPSDLVRFALAANPGSVNGELAGGMVMSLVTRRDSGIVVAVTSNIAYANTESLAHRVGDAFADQTR